MNNGDVARLTELRARVVAGQMALQHARQDLIEQLGDHMCGGAGGGPIRADLKALARARRTVRQAHEDLAQFSMVVALTTLGRQPAASSDKRVATRPTSCAGPLIKP